MRCFTACFVTWKHKEIKRNVQEQSLSPSGEPVEAVKLLADTTASLKEYEVVNLVSESEAKIEECSNGKKVGLDHSNVRIDSSIIDSHENGKREEGKDDKECVAMNLKEITLDDKECAAMNLKEITLDDKECVAMNLKESTLDELECLAMNSNESTFDDRSPVLEESSESLFSLSIDSRKQVCAAEMGDKEVSSNPARSQAIEIEQKSSFVHDDEDKENVNLDENRIFLSKEPIKKPKDSETVCETSLSSWLVESEKSFQKGSIDGNSPESEKNYKERRVLGAITGGSTTGCSSDDQLSIGTVGRYWLAGQGTAMGREMSIVSAKV